MDLARTVLPVETLANATIGSIAVSGSTTGFLTLFQKAIGGNSGGSNGASAGTAGNASSTMTLAQNGVATLSLDSIAEAGSGGSSENTTGGAGGTTTAVGSLAGNGNLVVGAFANSDQFNNEVAGHGSTINGGTFGTAGAGGNAAATATGVGTGTTSGHSSVTVVADVYGQNSGAVINSANGDGGNGGTGIAAASGTSAGPDTLNVTAYAFGGSGGQGQGAGFTGGNGNGGTSTATGTANGSRQCQRPGQRRQRRAPAAGAQRKWQPRGLEPRRPLQIRPPTAITNGGGPCALADSGRHRQLGSSIADAKASGVATIATRRAVRVRRRSMPWENPNPRAR